MVASCLANIHYTSLERVAMGKRTSLLQKLVNYDRKKFYNIGPRGLYHKTYYGRNLRFP